MRHATRRATTGFTLIELVVVIALLGILAAFAIPRFASLEREARIATAQGLAGGVRGAAAMAHSVWIVRSVSPITIEGNPVDMTGGYPDATDVALTMTDLTGFTQTVSASGDAATFTVAGAPNPTTCAVVYNDALADRPPVITTDLDGC